MKKKHIALGIGGAIGGIIAWKLVSRPSTVHFEDVADRIAHADHSHFVEVDGAEIHYQEFGDRSKPTLILVHGFTASVYVWKTVAPRLADAGFHVIAIDLVGFGYSEKPAWFDYSIQSQARMISRFMDRLGIGTATLVGSSYGGAVVLTVALDYPERVEKLVLANSVINDEPRRHPILQLASVPGIGEVVTPFLIDSKIFIRLRMHNTLAPINHHLITDDRVESIIRPLAAADGHRSVLSTGRNWKADRIEHDLEQINQPTLIVWGEEDTVVPIRHAETLYDSIVHSRLVVLKDCGHVPMEERPDIFTALVSEFAHDRKGRIGAHEDTADIKN